MEQVKKPSYPIEFKLKAIEQVLKSGKSVSKTAEDLGINQHTLRTWVSGHRGNKATTESFVDDTGHCSKEESTESRSLDYTGLRDQLKKLRAENLQLREERKVLIRAAALIATEVSRIPQS